MPTIDTNPADYPSNIWMTDTMQKVRQDSGSPGTQHWGTGVSVPLILPSVRLKDIRDGVQDYEYMNVLKNNGQSSTVSTQIASWMTNSYTFETSGSGLQTARKALGTAMHQLSYPPN